MNRYLGCMWKCGLAKGPCLLIMPRLEVGLRNLTVRKEHASSCHHLAYVATRKFGIYICQNDRQFAKCLIFSLPRTKWQLISKWMTLYFIKQSTGWRGFFLQKYSPKFRWKEYFDVFGYLRLCSTSKILVFVTSWIYYRPLDPSYMKWPEH